MTYQQKHDELQKLFSEKFDAYEKYRGLSLGSEDSKEHLKVKSEFESINNDLQIFLVMFKENNSSPNDEFGTKGERCK